MTDIFDKLSAPFAPDRVSWRVGSTNADKTKGLALAYIDARDVMDRLDNVVNPLNWQDRYEVHGPKTVCYLSIRFGDEWITKADAAGDTDVEAEKGAISDAFKRAAVKWGVGRYLYDLESPWVEVESRGRSHIIKKGEYARLQRLLGGRIEEAQKPGSDKSPLAVALSRIRIAHSRDDLKAIKNELAPITHGWPAQDRDTLNREYTAAWEKAA